MNLINVSLIEEKKSKFYGYLFEINNVSEIKTIINKLRVEHKKARHFPYAYKLTNTAGKTDDKEPSGTAGSPILNIIEYNNLNNHLIVIVRYFGGVKLGSSLLLRTYIKTAKACIKSNN